jgi:glycerol uptake facilitator-like aquaporin
MTSPQASLLPRLVAEGLGTAFLLAIVIGSGIMGERLAGGNVAIALLANSFATGCGLAVLIYVFAPISGAHFNPVVTFAMALRGRQPWREFGPYIVVQVLGAFCGVVAAHLMFGLPLFSMSGHVRPGWAQDWSEFVATFGLLMTILACTRNPSERTLGGAAAAIGAYIAAAYWFTSSTSFANPAVTLARAASDTFAGIRPDDVPGFIVAQILGASAALAIWDRVLAPMKQDRT